MNRSEQIKLVLTRRLMDQVYAPGSRFPSESVLAEEFMVNKMTMNKIVGLLVQSGYLVRGGRGAGTRVAKIPPEPGGKIAFLSTLIPYQLEIWRGVYREAMRQNFCVIMESPDLENLTRRLQLLKQQQVTGVISVGCGVPVLPEGMVLFCLDSEKQPLPPDREVHFITSDNFRGGMELMREILRRGHREVLIFSSERYHFRPDAPQTARIRGFHQAMAEHGISDAEARTFYAAPDSLDDARNFLRKVLPRYPDTTLIAADSDNSAELLHTAALQLKLDCPGRLALTGFGNVSALPIAEVDQNPMRQGELACRHLIEYARTGVCSAPECEYVETRLTRLEHLPFLMRK